MTQQPTLFSREAPVPSKSPDQDPDRPSSGCRAPTPRQVPHWLMYLELSVRVVVRLYLGLVLVALPWTPFWANNRLLLVIPHLPSIALSGITRGIVSGLGLLNIWIGVTDAIHHKQN
jgi:formate-dependent nitrite reductase membrane component NrfD